MAFDVTTEWADIHRKLGNYVPLPPKVSQEELTNQAIAAAEAIDPLESKSVEQLQALEEDDMDSAAIKAWEEKRLREMREQAKKRVFRHVYEISKQDYVREVNEAGPGVYVLLHMYQDYIPACRAINAAFEELCERFPTYKFVKIQATRCVENFRDRDCPTLLIYKEGVLVKQFAACSGLFGAKITADAVEWKLAEEGVWETEMEEKPEQGFKVRRVEGRDDEDSDEEDREYMSNHMPQRY